MPKLYSSRVVAQILKKQKFALVSQQGSHAKFRKTLPDGTTLTTIVPMSKKEIPLGTFRAILRQSRLNKTDFE